MSGNEILSREELDALVSGVDKGEVDTEGNISSEGDAKPYDITARVRHDNCDSPVLGMINDRFAETLGNSLFDLFRKRIEVKVVENQVIKYDEFTKTVDEPANINVVHITPNGKPAFFILEAGLVFVLVDKLYGGPGHVKEQTTWKNFTPTEMHVIKKFLGMCFLDMQKAFSRIADIDFEYKNSDIELRYIDVFKKEDELMTSKFHIEIDDFGGDMKIVMPYEIIEHQDSGKKQGENNASGQDPVWCHELMDNVYEAPIEVTAVIGETQLKLGQAMQLKKGDIIPVENPRHVILRTNDMTVLLGELGVHNNSYAVMVTEKRC